jgi:predicted  nucleic acid-binding Zn-ribbon protein
MTEAQRFTTLKSDIQTIKDQKIRIEERFKREKEQLEKLLGEIQTKGYDPKKLTEIRQEKENLLKAKLGELEKSIKEAQDKLSKIEV